MGLINHFIWKQQTVHFSQMYTGHSPRQPTFFAVRHFDTFKIIGIIQYTLLEHRIRMETGERKMARKSWSPSRVNGADTRIKQVPRSEEMARSLEVKSIAAEPVTVKTRVRIPSTHGMPGWVWWLPVMSALRRWSWGPHSKQVRQTDYTGKLCVQAGDSASVDKVESN